jgi:hypothetical protein
VVGSQWSVVSKKLGVPEIFNLRKGKILLKVLFVLTFIGFGFFACAEKKKGGGGVVIAKSDSYAASLYRQNCAICHGVEAYGKSVDGKPVPSLRFGTIKKKSRSEIYQQIAHGKLPMPSFEGQLTEREINFLVDFVMYDLQGRDPEKTRTSENSKNQGKKNENINNRS